jgi:hypothetical protein
MKQFLLIFMLVFLPLVTFGQRDSLSLSRKYSKGYTIDEQDVNLSIYPVPVRDNAFTIKSDKEIYSIKITNIIGQEIYMANYPNPIFTTKIVLDNPKRGMYLVVITFSNNNRLVRRILIEGLG